MRKIIYGMMASLDGYITGPDGGLDWAIIDAELHTFVNNRERKIRTFLYGRGLYETMAAHWPTADQNPDAPDFEVEYARIWQQIPKVVFSKTLEQVGDNTRLVRDNIFEEVRRLKAQPGADMIVGGATLAAAFLAEGLVDGVEVYVHPVIVGSGTPFLPNVPQRTNLKLVETQHFGSGVVFLSYEVA